MMPSVKIAAFNTLVSIETQIHLSVATNMAGYYFEHMGDNCS